MGTTVSNPRRNVAGRIQVALIGCNHRTAPVELRERVSFSQQQALDAADELRKQGILEEAVVLSTCNRSELYGVPGEGGTALTEAMEEFFTSFHGIPRKDLTGNFYRWTGREAVLHLYRVAAGIDSMMLGEAEILGQLRTAYNSALEHGATGPVLNRVFQGALEVGKRVRAETEVGARPMSVALAGVKLAERVFGNLKGHVALIIGAGAVAEQVVEQLRNRNIGRLQVVNRSFDRAADLAARFNGNALPWESLENLLSEPDILITSAGGTGPIITRKMLEMALEARGGRPIFVVDLGVPRNVESAASGLYNLYTYNVDDLGEVVEQNKKAREAEIPRVEALIAEHVGKFETWRAALEAGSIVDDLRARFLEQRQQLLEENLKQMPEVSPDERARIARITEELIERMLNEPGERLRTGRGMRGRLAAVEALRHIFALDEDKCVKSLRIGTRGSALALWQANHIKDRLAELHGVTAEIVRIRTSGDKFQTASFAQLNAQMNSAIGSEGGGKGIFIKELEDALLAKTVDLAVHSMKDVPTETPRGLVFAAITKREDPRDCLISREGRKLADLPEGARVGTSSLRRQAQLRHLRPDLQILELRGNVDTRMRKLTEGEYDAIVLALAGVTRLGLSARVTEIFSPEVMVPAVAQGALGIETREEDHETSKLVAALNDAESRSCVEAERALLRELEGGCQVPLGAWARMANGELLLEACLLSPDGKQFLRDSSAGIPADAHRIGKQLGHALKAAGGARILQLAGR